MGGGGGCELEHHPQSLASECSISEILKLLYMSVEVNLQHDTLEQLLGLGDSVYIEGYYSARITNKFAASIFLLLYLLQSFYSRYM